MDPEEIEAREFEMHEVTKECYNSIYYSVWSQSKSGLTPAESRIVWMRLVNLMINSVILELEHELHVDQIQVDPSHDPGPSSDPVILRGAGFSADPRPEETKEKEG